MIFDVIAERVNVAATHSVIIIKEDVDYYINFTVLEKGIVLEITRDNSIEITLNRIDKQIIKEVQDNIISTEWKLIHEGNQAMFIKDNKVFELKMVN